MTKLSFIFLTGTALGALACNPPESTSTNQPADSSAAYPEMLQQALEAHGGLDTWQSFGRLEYDLYRDGEPVDHQLIALHSRKVLIENEQYRIGYDGQQVWVSPDTSAYPGSSARFYHNLQFYFFALPFVFADPGIRYETLDTREFQGKMYDALKISYQDNVGDAPEDVYIAYFDSSSHQLYLLLYTVTYFSQSPGENYNARVYENWQRVNGVLVPQSVVSYRWENDTLGAPRGSTEYRNVVLDEIPPDQSVFLMPVEATVSER